MKNKLFLTFYFVLSFFIYLISIPFFIFLSFKSKYKKSIPARFFLYKNPPFKDSTYWFHSCSYGETKALAPIVEKFEDVNFSVITNTGYEAAKSYNNSDVRFLPFEIFLPFWIKPCKSLVVMEAELWYMLFFIAKKRCKKTILLNARISDRSYKKYLKLKWFYKKIFENIDIVLAQSNKDKERLKKLGAKNIEVVGNIKTYFKPHIKREYMKKKPLIVLASTHKNEEEMILKELNLEKYQIVVVPRHPERFNEVYELMKKFGKVERLSEKLKMENEKIYLNSNLILCDKMGELVNLYAVADFVILGGSFIDNVGGHNPIEAAYFNVPIISGKHYFNQIALYKEVENINIIDDIKKLNEAILSSKKSRIKNKIDLNKIVDLIKD